MVNRKIINKRLSTTIFSKLHLIAFAIVFAAIGGYFVFQTFAAPQALDSFDDFKNNEWDDIFLKRWQCSSDCYTSLLETGTPWPDGSGMWEVATPYGSGFRFVHNGQTPHGSGGGIQIVDWDHLIDRQDYLGKTFDLSGKLMFPASGNPNGFADYGDWNALWEFGPGVTGNNQLGVNGITNKIYVRTYDPTGGHSRKAEQSGTIQYDRWYDFRWQVKSSHDSSGFVKFWLDGVQLANWAGPTKAASTEAPWLQWGWYGGNNGDRNEILYSSLTIDAGVSTPPPPPPAAPTVSLSANPTSITTGGSSTLSWSSTNATSCSASGAWSGSKITTGTQSVTPAATSTYTLTCTGTGGSANALATVTVTATPPSTPTITSNINNGDSVSAGTAWSVSVTPTPSLVEFWADGVKLADDTTAPYSTVLNLTAGTHRLGLCTTVNSQRTCRNDVSTGIFAVITITTSSPPAHIAAADLNNDGSVNILDLSILLKHYGTTAAEADINGDGTVNVSDLSILLNKYQ